MFMIKIAMEIYKRAYDITKDEEGQAKLGKDYYCGF